MQERPSDIIIDHILLSKYLWFSVTICLAKTLSWTMLVIFWYFIATIFSDVFVEPIDYFQIYLFDFQSIFWSASS